MDLVFRTWGGRRAGAGRKRAPGKRPGVAHRKRDAHRARCPVHVTLRANARLPSFRAADTFRSLRGALAASSSKASFRLLHFSVQRDHVHLLVEADDSASLSRGVQGLAIRAARAVNRVLGRRGSVWADRFHARDLTTPREVRNALVYVLSNLKKHVRAARGLDPCSSAAWFSGWALASAPRGASPLATARTWLARVGWRRWGPIGADETPRPLRRRQ